MFQDIWDRLGKLSRNQIIVGFIAIAFTMFLVVAIVLAMLVMTSNHIGHVTNESEVIINPDPQAFTDVENQIEDTNQELIDLEAERDNLITERDTLNTEITDLNEQINNGETGLVTQRDALVTQRNALNTEISDLETEVTTLETEIADLNTQITSLETSVDGRTSVLNETQMIAASENAAYFAPNAFSDFREISIVFDEITMESGLHLVGAGTVLIEEGVSFTHCGMLLAFEYSEANSNVYLTYRGISYDSYGYGADRISDGEVFNITGIYIIDETQISAEIIDQNTEISASYDENVRRFFLVDVNPRTGYCDADGLFLYHDFESARWSGYVGRNAGYVGNEFTYFVTYLTDFGEDSKIHDLRNR